VSLYGQCYLVAFLALTEGPPGWMLCHGYPRFPDGSGRRFGHAWLETADGQVVLETGEPCVLRRDVYYQDGEIEEAQVRRCTISEARAKLVETGRYGPWEPDPYPDVLYGEVREL